VVTVSSISEFELIRRLQLVLDSHSVQGNSLDNILLGIGDDATVAKMDSKIEVATTDTLVEGVHFISESISMNDLGWKSIAVNLSDIAAMGCSPVYSLVTLGLKPTQTVQSLEDLYEGMAEISESYGGKVVGGDIVRSDTFFISVTVVGAPLDSSVMRRDTARPGDLVAVTGHLGCSAAGLRVIMEHLSITKQAQDHFTKSHLRPLPRIEIGLSLARQGIKCAMDISDGLLNDLSKICAASNVSATVSVNDLPIHENLQSCFPNIWDQLAVGGGEDYELLFTIPGNLKDKISQKPDVGFKIIGKITEGSEGVTVIGPTGESKDYSTGGWDHFKEHA
tara:strand:+ start:1212 stop:2219 length:1008 start_codon:yes stop_codon:yes gene_type:complete